MATSGVKDSVNELQNICECTICYNTYDEDKHVPRIMPCNHTFCSDCLSKHCSRQKITCPLCNKVHTISNKNILIFPKDNTRRELKCVLEKLSKVLCGVCGQQDNNSYFCYSCDMRICPGCYSDRKYTTCQNHRLDRNPDSQLASKDSSKNDLSSSKVCLLNGHEQNDLKFYCAADNCCKTVCANCIVEFHSEHIHFVKPVIQEYESLKKAMQDKCNRTKVKIDSAKQTLINLNKERLAMKGNFDKGKERLGVVTRKGIQYMKQYEELECKRWSHKLKDNLSNLQKCRECLQNFIDNATECCKISERSMASENIAKFLSTEKNLSQKLDCFTEMNVDQDIKQLSPSYEFEMKETIHEIQTKVNELAVPHNTGTFRRLQAHIFGDEQSLRTVCKSVGSVIALTLLAMQLIWSALFVQAMDEHIDNSFLEFSNNTDFICQSQYLQLASNYPLDDLSQTCGKGNHLYVYNGAFSDRSLDIVNNDSITFKIQIRTIGTTPNTVFEFGMSNGSLSRRHLIGPPSREYFGWILKQCDDSKLYSLINTNGQILQSDISIMFNMSFKFKIELNRDRSIALRFCDGSNNIFKYIDKQRLLFRSYERVFFVKFARSFEVEQTASILSKNIFFDRSTLYHGMFISENNKHISNNPSAGLTETHLEENNVYLDIVLHNCSQKCMYVLEFKVKNAKQGGVFSLHLMNSSLLSFNNLYNLLVFSYISVDSPDQAFFSF